LVDVFGEPEESAEVVAVLQRLNYSVRLQPPDMSMDDWAPDPTLVAAIVINDAPEPLPLCSALAKSCPVMVISAEANFAFRLSAARAGVKALLRRPVNATELAEWLESFDIPSGPRPATSVVIVDDDELAAELTAHVLRAAGMTVEIVCDPTLALQAIETRLPDLVLMDMQMPGVSGVELAQIIRQVRQFISMPIIFLSGERDKRRQLEARKLGGDDFIVKTSDPVELIARVRLRADRARLLRSMIERDGLTGLYDHSRFNTRLLQELERCRRTGAELSLVMIDIDHFKKVNDTFGHPVGDVVIRTLANSLTAALRKIDIIGRYGGEEFGVVLLDTGVQGAGAVIDRIRQRFSEIPFKGDGAFFHVSFSGGVASSRQHQDLPALMEAADQALYRAKANGRNKVEIGNR
jgi:diguanylate cyclase (GGDEF)-like protein